MQLAAQGASEKQPVILVPYPFALDDAELQNLIPTKIARDDAIAEGIITEDDLKLVPVNIWDSELPKDVDYGYLTSGGYAAATIYEAMQKYSMAQSCTKLTTKTPFCGATQGSLSLSNKVNFPYFIRTMAGRGYTKKHAFILKHYNAKRVCVLYGRDDYSQTGLSTPPVDENDPIPVAPYIREGTITGLTIRASQAVGFIALLTLILLCARKPSAARYSRPWLPFLMIAMFFAIISTSLSVHRFPGMLCAATTGSFLISVSAAGNQRRLKRAMNAGFVGAVVLLGVLSNAVIYYFSTPLGNDAHSVASCSVLYAASFPISRYIIAGLNIGVSISVFFLPHLSGYDGWSRSMVSLLKIVYVLYAGAMCIDFLLGEQQAELRNLLQSSGAISQIRLTGLKATQVLTDDTAAFQEEVGLTGHRVPAKAANPSKSDVGAMILLAATHHHRTLLRFKTKEERDHAAKAIKGALSRCELNAHPRGAGLVMDVGEFTA
ncbi:hypothetical protein HDU96_009696 [Phlyctochytrium bullatum]|nr:hypothetical protein HDU96_009696 [Phlyctochytrium bullatum]